MVVAEIIIAAVIAFIVLLTVVRSVRIIPQARARNVERFGRYRKTLEPGLNFIVPLSTASSRRLTCVNRLSRSPGSR
jgi:regulator of protease activity HflC (stomatin/prohibitin superfamily)